MGYVQPARLLRFLGSLSQFDLECQQHHTAKWLALAQTVGILVDATNHR